MNSKSKFAGLAEARLRDIETDAEAGSLEAPAPARETAPSQKRKSASREKPQTAEAEAEPIVKLTAYIPKSLHKSIKITMLENDADYSFSDLIVRLLRDWERKQAARAQ